MAEQRANSAAHELVFDEAEAGLCLVAPDRTILRVNAAWLRATGYTAEQVIGVDVVELCPEIREAALAMHARARSGHRVEIPRHVQLVNGRETWWEGSLAPVEMEVGTGVLVTRREIPPVQSEEEARARAVQLEAVLDCIADGVIVCDRQGRMIRSTPAADEILKLPANERRAPVAEWVGSEYEILSEDGRRLEPEEMVAVRAAVHGETVRGAIQQLRKGDDAPRWLMLSGMPLFVSGEHTGAVISLTDITERKRAEEELAVVTRLYAVLSRVNEAIVRTRDEQPLYGEVCRIIAEEGGFPLVWVGLVKESAILPAASWGRAAGYLHDVTVRVEGELGQGPTGTCVRENRPVINNDFDCNASTAPWREAALRHGLRASAAFPLRFQGHVIGAATLYAANPGTFTVRHIRLLEALSADVSYALDAMEQERLRARAEHALREREQRLREADQRKDEFLGMLSHELRNPLSPIRNSIFVLQHADPAGEQARTARAVIERQTEHLTRLVDDLLDVTRIARGKIALRRGRVDLRELVTRTADDFRSMMEKRGLAFRAVLPDEKLWVDADATRLAQIVGNLLHNAAKYSRRGDGVTLGLRVAGAEAEISVHDTGAGIEPALLPHLFDPFVQGERTLARTEGGLGLGLALVKGIAELHGGTARADSAGKGKGAEFVVSLPLVRPAASSEKLGARTRRSGAGRRVLVVDDNYDAAESLAQVVQMLGHSAEIAYDGPTAVAKARALLPDTILCDIGLPGMSGYEVARTLRASGLDRVQLVALSGYARPEDVSAALEAGFDRHVSKPADVDDLERLLA